MNTEVVIRLIFFIPLFHLTVSSGLPPGTMMRAMRYPSNQKPLLSSLSKPMITSTSFINANSTKSPSPDAIAITAAVNNSTSANDDIIMTPSTNKNTTTTTANTNTPSYHDPDQAARGTSISERGKERHDGQVAAEFSPPTSNSKLTTAAKANEKIISQPSHDSHYQNHHDSVNSNSNTTTTPATSSKTGALAWETNSGGRAHVRLTRSDRILEGGRDRDTDTTEGKEQERIMAPVNMMGMENSIGAKSADSGNDSRSRNTRVSMPLQHVDGEKNNVESSPQNLPPIALPLVQNYTAKVPLRGSCNSTFRCMGEFVECSRGHCRCQDGYAPSHDERDVCRDLPIYNLDLPQTDPTMIGVIIGLILMSFTLCIVLRLFAKARFRENRTIFNTPNPRLMNVSLLKGGKQLLRGNSGGNNPSRSRRGSQTSIQSAVAAEAHQRNQPTTQQPSAVSPPNALSPTSPQNDTQTPTQGMGGYPRPKTLRQASVENETAGVSKAAKSKYRQDSVSSNV